MTHNFKSLLTISLLFSLMANNAFANHSKDHKHEITNVTTNQKEENIKPNPDETILVVHGVVCSFCSYGIQKK